MAFFRQKAGDPAENKGRFRREFGLYTLVYLIFFCVIFLPVIIRDGLVLVGDGYGMYYPTLVNFRRSLIEFGSNLRSGSFRFPLMNFDFGLGTDNLTTIIAYYSFPLYYLCVFLPVSALPMLLTCIIFLLDYLSGVTFLRLCRHFGHHSFWNSLMALSYACGTCLFGNYLFNPHFMYMLVAFPLMVIGLDRIIQKTGWRLFCFCVFWLGLCSFTLLLYTLPFLALFAIVRVRFVYREHFVPNLIRAFLRCLPVLITGFLLTAFIELPLLYLLRSSARSVGNGNLNYVQMLIPNLSRMSECFFLIEPTANRDPLAVNPMFIAMPGLILTLLVLRKHTELRVHLLIAIACVSVPLIDCGMNGFQYCLIRWGCVPSLAFAFGGSVGMSEFSGFDRKQYRRTVGILCFYWLTFSSIYFLKYEAGDLCAGLITAGAICRLIPPLCRLWSRTTAAAGQKLRRFRALLKEKTPSAKRYLASFGMIAAAICGLLCLVVLIFLPIYTFYPQLLIGAGLTAAASALLMRKQKWASVCGRVLALCFFASAIVLYLPYHDSSYEQIRLSRPVEMMLEEQEKSDAFSRNLNLTMGTELSDGNASEITEPDGNKKQNYINLVNRSGSVPLMIEIKEGTTDCLSNYSLICGTPNFQFFHNMTDSSIIEIKNRLGLTGTASNSVTSILGLDDREELYSLFGIRLIGTLNYPVSGFGLTEIRTEKTGENDQTETASVYEYAYALPLGVTYDSCMSRDRFDSLGTTEFPFAVMQSAYAELPDGSSLPADTVPQQDEYRCDAQIEKTFVKTNSVGMDVHRIKAELNTDVSDCFLYLEFSGCHSYYPPAINVVNLYVSVDGTTERFFFLMNDRSEWPWVRQTDCYTIPLGYRETPVHSIEFEMPAEYEEFTVRAVPASVLTDAYAARCEETLQNVQFTTNRLDGDITVSEDRLLSVSLLHGSGWRVTVDGKEAPLCKVNGLFLGVQVPAGTHHVRFTYRTPGLTAGMICSCAGVLLWILMEILARRKKKQDGKKA